MIKQMLVAVATLGISTSAMAAGSGIASFVGPSVEVGAGVSKTNTNDNINEKLRGDVSLRGHYGFNYSDNWVGGVEVAVKPLHRQISNSAIGTKQKIDASASYTQGYRLNDDLLAYGKVGYHYGRFENLSGKDRHLHGVGYGAGIKHAVNDKVTIGGEWEQVRYSHNGHKATNNSYMATLGYRF